jgi:hypothetical protein
MGLLIGAALTHQIHRIMFDMAEAAYTRATEGARITGRCPLCNRKWDDIHMEGPIGPVRLSSKPPTEKP